MKTLSKKIGRRCLLELHLTTKSWHVVDLNFDISDRSDSLVINRCIKLVVSVLCLSISVSYRPYTIYKCKHEPEFIVNVDGIEGCKKCYKIFKP